MANSDYYVLYKTDGVSKYKKIFDGFYGLFLEAENMVLRKESNRVIIDMNKEKIIKKIK
jgi:hypothetical protein